MAFGPAKSGEWENDMLRAQNICRDASSRNGSCVRAIMGDTSVPSASWTRRCYLDTMGLHLCGVRQHKGLNSAFMFILYARHAEECFAKPRPRPPSAKGNGDLYSELHQSNFRTTKSFCLFLFAVVVM